MKIAVMNNFDGDEFGFQYLNLNIMNDQELEIKNFNYFSTSSECEKS